MASAIYFIFMVTLAVLSFPDSRLCKASDTSVKRNKSFSSSETRYINRYVQGVSQEKVETPSYFPFHQLDHDRVRKHTSKSNYILSSLTIHRANFNTDYYCRTRFSAKYSIFFIYALSPYSILSK